MVLAEKNGESCRNGRRSRGPSPNGHAQADSTSEDEVPVDKIRVGRDYQAVCPELQPEALRKPELLPDRALLVWSPTEAISDNKLEEYIVLAKEKYGYNGEQALGMLFWHKHDLERAILDLANFTPFPDEWTVEDKVLFEQAFQFHGKSFHRIKQMLPDKSIASLVKYYYGWKKTRTRSSLMDKQARKLQNPKEDGVSEAGSEIGSNEESDHEEKRQMSRNGNNLENMFASYSESEFIQDFRVSRRVAEHIAEKFQRSIYFHYQCGQNGKLSAFDHTIIFLWFVGQEDVSYREVSKRFRISLGMLRKLIVKMINFLCDLSSEVISWPDREEQEHIKEKFSVHGLLDVIGVIDCFHIPINKPFKNSNFYKNTKGYFSMQFQAVCDHRGMIRDILIGYPGSVHVGKVFQESHLSSDLSKLCQENYILGNSGYPCLRNLLIPFKDNGNLTKEQLNYNMILSKTRYVKEYCSNILKQKFRQLCRLKLKGDNDINNFLRASCVLHNLALNDKFYISDIDDINDPAVTEYDNILLPDEFIHYQDGIAHRYYIASILPNNS